MKPVFPSQLAEMPKGSARLSSQTMNRYFREWASKNGYVPFIKSGPGKGSVAFTPANAALALTLMELERIGISGVLIEPYVKPIRDAQFVINRAVGGASFANGGFQGALDRLSDGEEVFLIVEVVDDGTVTARLITPSEEAEHDEARKSVDKLYAEAGLSFPRHTLKVSLAPVLRPLIEFLKED